MEILTQKSMDMELDEEVEEEKVDKEVYEKVALRGDDKFVSRN